uniref:Uncharacterized protein n=1 Tax=Mus spicilegus TaxID=10103 RepID=A0A8C6HQX1_MUSSI
MKSPQSTSPYEVKHSDSLGGKINFLHLRSRSIFPFISSSKLRQDHHYSLF